MKPFLLSVLLVLCGGCEKPRYQFLVVNGNLGPTLYRCDTRTGQVQYHANESLNWRTISDPEP